MEFDKRAFVKETCSNLSDEDTISEASSPSINHEDVVGADFEQFLGKSEENSLDLVSIDESYHLEHYIFPFSEVQELEQ